MKMKIKKAILLALTIAMILPVNVSAAGNTMIDITNKNPKVGDTFTVKVNASEKGKMSLSYNSTVIEFVGSNVDAVATSSHSIEFTGKNVEVTFKAKGEGSSGIIIESSSLTGSSITVPVAKAAGTQTEETNKPEESTQTDDVADEPAVESNNAAVNTDAADGADFVVDGMGYVVSEKYKKDSIPEGFSVTEIEINGKKVKELTNGIMTLVYLKPKDDTSGAGEFYILDTENSAVRPLIMLGDNTNYVICTDDGEPFSESLTQAYFSLGDKEYEAYQIKDSQSEFYYIYGVNSQGAYGWYAFDSITSQVSRADTMSLAMIDEIQEEEAVPKEPAKEPEKESGFSLSPKILMGCGIVFIVLLIILIIANIVLRNKEDDDDLFDDDDDEEIREEVKTTVREPKVSTPATSAPVRQDFAPERTISTPQSSVNSDELIDELIKKASENSAIEIMDLDDM